MKKINLLRMVVCLLLSLFMATSCSSTDDEGFDDEPELVSEVEDAISDELDDAGDDEGFGDDGDVAGGDDFEDEGFGDDDVAGGDDFEDDGEVDAGAGDDFGDDDFGDDDFGDDDLAGGDDDFGDEDFGDEDFDDDSFEDDGFGDVAEAVDGGDDFDSFDAEEAVSEALTQDVAINEPESVGDGFDIDEPAPIVEEEPIAPAETFAETINISSIDFKSSEGGGGIIMIKTSAPASISQRENPEQRQMMIDIDSATIPESLKRPFIMKDFSGTPFAGLNAYEQEDGNTVSLVVQMKQGYALPGVQQEGNSILVLANGNVAPTMAQVDEEQPDASNTFVAQAPTGGQGIMSAANFNDFIRNNQRYYGRPISIQASQVQVRDLINFIADESGANILVSNNVKGQMSLKLREVPWDQALVTVMKSHGLGYVREGSVLRISTLKELEEIATMVSLSQRNIDNLQPKKVKMFTINFADTKEVEDTVKKLLTPEKGIITVDKRTNNVIVTDTDEVLKKVSSIIQNLDVAPSQVMIEGKIVEAQESFIQRVGMRWGTANGVNEISPNGGRSGSPILMRPSVNLNSTTEDDITAAAGLFSLSIGTLKTIGDLTARLALSETENLTKILSSPRIIAVNKEKAEITQETEALTVTSTVSDGIVSRVVERTPVKLNLSVTPQITNTDSVMMDFEVTREFLGSVEDTQSLARAVNKRSAKSKMLVKSGETAVIGGIYDSLGLTGVTGPVGLKDIPIIGWLFKSRVKDSRKNELIIFLTPKIQKKG